MDRQEIISKLKEITDNYLTCQGLELVDLAYRYEGKNLFLRILADRPEGGISLDECADLNRKICLMLDEKDILKERYILEVSSPGLDRPLKTKSDFSRCINRKVKFFLRETINGKLEWDGVVIKVEDDSIFIDIGGLTLEIPLKMVTQAKQILADF